MRIAKFIATLATGLALATSALAAEETFDIVWSGASFGNGASATGFITLDTSLVGSGSSNISISSVTNLGITVSGASAGNGTFGRSDFSLIRFWSPSPLDFSRQLIGQSLSNGSTFGNTNLGSGGDFNLFRSNASAPSGTWFFTLTTQGGDKMQVTSMAPVPEPETYAMLMAGLSLVGFVARRKKQAA